MQRERVTDDIIVFISDLYAQVTATVIMTSAGAVLFDTLLYPDETLQIKRFIEKRLHTRVRYVINSHFHADHTTGTSLFEGAEVISHQLCRHMLDIRGRSSLEQTKSSSGEMTDVSLVLPSIVFDDRFTLQCGNKTLEMWSTPGHSFDSIVCLVQEEQVLLASDTIMPIPYFVDGDLDLFRASLEGLQPLTLDTIIQGHGEVVLRGEIEEKIQSDIAYLDQLSESVDQALNAENTDEILKTIDVESCGKSRTLLNGAVEELHRQNMNALIESKRQAIEIASK